MGNNGKELHWSAMYHYRDVMCENIRVRPHLLRNPDLGMNTIDAEEDTLNSMLDNTIDGLRGDIPNLSEGFIQVLQNSITERLRNASNPTQPLRPARRPVSSLSMHKSNLNQNVWGPQAATSTNSAAAGRNFVGEDKVWPALLAVIVSLCQVPVGELGFCAGPRSSGRMKQMTKGMASPSWVLIG
jgi:hypothetical protein